MTEDKMTIKWKEKTDMCVRTAGEVQWLSYPVYEKEDYLIHGFSTRMGGVSEGIFASMNLSFQRGDDNDAVMENFRRISGAIGFPLEKLVLSAQTHTTNIRVVTEADCGKGVLCEKDFTDIDGLITNVPGIVLGTSYADCVPLFFVDPVHKAIGLSHSGWRGTVNRMGKVTVEAMQREYGSKPEDLICAIGPSICQDCYEVSEDVILEFSGAFRDEQHGELFYRKENGKYQLDLWKANEILLLEAGVRREKLLLPGICTCCNPEFLFSHRASHGKRGNLEAFLGMRG